MNGTDLLANFRENRSEAAFGELVRRYTNLVYSVAARRLQGSTLAEEATQMVFIRLAESAPELHSDAELVGWLHRTTLHVAIDLWRSETRRRTRETLAVAMQTESTPSWTDLAPVVDEALNELAEPDRQAILLRFFAEKSMRELGVALGVSEDAAKMRVSRALERLRDQLSARGVTCSVAVLGALLAEHTIQAAPAALMGTLATLRISELSAGASGGASFFHLVRSPFVAGLMGVIGLTVATVVFVRSHRAVSNAAFARVPEASAPAPGNSGVSAALSVQPAEELRPAERIQANALKLLEGVARARQRMTSGSLEIGITTRNQPKGWNKQRTIKIVFDGEKRRFESTGREYAYIGTGEDAAKAAEAKMAELHLDNEAAVQAGLLRAMETRVIDTTDGDVLLKYRETDGHPDSVNVTGADRAGDFPDYLFDPRCLGLTTHLSPLTTIDGWIGYYSAAQSISLVGQETIEGVKAWHIRVLSKHGDLADFWIEVAHPVRVLKHIEREDVLLAKYDESKPDDPLPVQVTVVGPLGGRPGFEQQVVRSRTVLNVSVDPVLWTLAGLNIPVGTPVIDLRNHRSFGYWNGSGLSEEPVSRKSAPPGGASNLLEARTLLEQDPASAEALQAARWMILNVPDGLDVEKAAEVILQNHIENTNLVDLAQELERVRPRSSTNLLKAMLENNPAREVRGQACFGLALLAKDQADHGRNAQALAEAQRLFDRVSAEFSQVKRRGYSLAELARPELHELAHVRVGQPAFRFEGEDLEGQPIKLNDYQGKVVLLVFWATGGSCPDMERMNKLQQRYADKPFVIVGVACDEDLNRAKATAAEKKMSWRSVWDGRQGPIATAWNNHGWPSCYVLDRDLTIRDCHVSEVFAGEAVRKVFEAGAHSYSATNQN